MSIISHSNKKRYKIARAIFLGLVICSLVNGGIHSPAQIQNQVDPIDREFETPQTAATNVWILLDDINITHAQHSDIIPLSGNVIWFNGTDVFNLTNYDIFPVVNTISQDGTGGTINYTTTTDAFGNFSIDYIVPTDFDVATNMTIYATILENASIIVGPGTYSFTPPFVLDITADSSITITTNIANPVLTNDQYNVLINLVDDNGDPLSASNISLFRNGDVSDILQSGISIDATGQAIFSFTQLDGLTTLGAYYPGYNLTNLGPDTYYQIDPSNSTVGLARITAISADITFTNPINRTDTRIYTGNEMEITGEFWYNNDLNLPLANREIEVIVNTGVSNVSLGTFNTDAAGAVDTTVNFGTNGVTSNGTFEIYLHVRNGGEVVFDSADITFAGSMSIVVIDQPAPPSANPNDYGGNGLNWTGILWPILVGGALVAGLVLFQRYRMERTHRRSIKLRKVDLEKFAIMDLLYKVDRRREAIAYSYKIFADLINEKYGLTREINQTLREFGIMCVTKYGLDPLRTYPYIALVENVTYGAYALTPEAYERALKVFARIFQEITGTALNFALEVTDEMQMLEGVTLKIGGE